jgi:VanZ family protein
VTVVRDSLAAVPARRRYMPAALWALVIVALTSVPGRAVPEVAIPHIDKVVHATLYAVLAALTAWSLSAPRRVRALLAVVALASLFGAADEWHQQFIPGRSQDRNDWLADSVGAALGVLFITAALARREFTS